MSEPKRIQRRRSKGWRMPESAVYVGRPNIFGNPFRVSAGGHKVAVERFRDMITRTDGPRSGWVDYEFCTYPSNSEIAEELRGRDLACWCPLEQPCHADVLLEIANATATQPTDTNQAAVSAADESEA